MITKGTWVLIEEVVLPVGQRAENLPEDTKNTPIKKWVKGYLQEDAKIGDKANIVTITGRKEEGVLVEANPFYDIDYGVFVPELLQIGKQVKEITFGGDQ